MSIYEGKEPKPSARIYPKTRKRITSATLWAVAADNVCDFLTVKQCPELEKPFQTLHTDQIFPAGLQSEDNHKEEQLDACRYGMMHWTEVLWVLL